MKMIKNKIIEILKGETYVDSSGKTMPLAE
jgi:hypothetical protein